MIGYIIFIEEAFGSDKLTAIISQDNIGQKPLEIKSELKALDKILNTKVELIYFKLQRVYNITKKSEMLSNSLKIKKNCLFLKKKAII